MASDLGLHGLPSSHLWYARHIWDEGFYCHTVTNYQSLTFSALSQYMRTLQKCQIMRFVLTAIYRARNWRSDTVVLCCCFILLLLLFFVVVVVVVDKNYCEQHYSVDPDHTPCSVASELGLHRLPSTKQTMAPT